MAKKKTTGLNFKPFFHENLDFKNNLLTLARNCGKKSGAENALASALIYASIAEYLAEYLLLNLQHSIFVGSYYQYSGIVYIDERKSNRKRTMGEIIKDLKDYQFPDKDAVVDLLEKISKSRNDLFHNLAKLGPNETSKMDDGISSIQTLTEDLINRLNIVTNGLQKIFAGQQSPAEG